MPYKHRGKPGKGAGSDGGQGRENRGGGYSGRWLRESRDDVPQTGKPVRKNPVVEAIMAKGNPVSQQSGEPEQSGSEQAPVDSK